MRFSFPSAQTNRPREPCRRKAAHPRRRQHLGLTIGAVVGLAMLTAFRRGVREAYAACLTKVDTFARKPTIGAQWPRDGYSVPSVEVFMEAYRQRASSHTLEAVIQAAAERVRPSGTMSYTSGSVLVLLSSFISTQHVWAMRICAY